MYHSKGLVDRIFETFLFIKQSSGIKATNHLIVKRLNKKINKDIEPNQIIKLLYASSSSINELSKKKSNYVIAKKVKENLKNKDKDKDKVKKAKNKKTIRTLWVRRKKKV